MKRHIACTYRADLGEIREFSISHVDSVFTMLVVVLQEHSGVLYNFMVSEFGSF